MADPRAEVLARPGARTAVPFYLVDVFAEEPLTGNPLALVADAERLDPSLLPVVAREFNQSETTFLLPSTAGDATWRLRSFTPAGAEVFGAGHNALGAWWWLASACRLELAPGATRFTQQLGDRVLPVEVIAGDRGAPELVVMEQAAPTFGAIPERPEGLAAALGLAPADLETDLPAQVVDTGAAHLLVPAVDRAAVDRAAPDAQALLAELRVVGGQGCYLFSLDPVRRDSTAYARFFNPTVGIWEDPATGSAAGPLACHLVAHNVVDDGATVVVEQGHAQARPSTIQVDVEGDLVRLGGAGVVVAEGTLRV
jgi:trans-2,3-dihydro-3-hydroxyanthranilate isomerase